MEPGSRRPSSPSRRTAGSSRRAATRAAGTARRSSRRPPQRPQKRTPPFILALLIIVPVVGIGIVLTLRARRPAATETAAPAADPNKDIAALEKRFEELSLEQRKVLQGDRESTRFELQVRNLIKKWDRWIGDFDRIFRAKRGPDGEWQEGFFAYSKMRSRASLLRNDLTRISGF